VQSTPTGVTKVWSRAIGDVDSAAIERSGRLYLGTTSGHVWALDSATGANVWGGSGYYDCADGPVKSYVFPDFTSSRVYLSTTNKVWGLSDDGASVSLSWSATTATSPSTPLYVQSYGLVFAGSS